MINKYEQSGFSLIELLLVVTIIGIISAIGIPSFKKARTLAETTASTSNLRSFSTLEVDYFSRNNRFARLSELNAVQNNNLGTTIPPSSLVRGNITYTIYNNSLVASPSDANLKVGYIILAVRPAFGSDPLYTTQLDQSGVITQLTP